MSQDMMALLKAAKNKYKRNDSKIIRPSAGKNLVQFISNGDASKFWQDSGVHWLKADPNAQLDVVIGSRLTVYGEQDAVGQAIEKAIKAQTDDEGVKLAKSWKARETVLLNCIVRDGPNKSDEPQIYELTKGTFGAVTSIMEEWEDYEVCIIIERTGTGLDTKYEASAAAPSKQVKITDDQRSKKHDLLGFIEQNFFRPGDEAKALAALSGYTGMNFAALGAPTRGAGLLTSASGSVAEKPADKSVETKKPEKPVEEPKQELMGDAEADAPATAPDTFDDAMSNEDIDKMLAGLD